LCHYGRVANESEINSSDPDCIAHQHEIAYSSKCGKLALTSALRDWGTVLFGYTHSESFIIKCVPTPHRFDCQRRHTHGNRETVCLFHWLGIPSSKPLKSHAAPLLGVGV